MSKPINTIIFLIFLYVCLHFSCYLVPKPSGLPINMDVIAQMESDNFARAYNSKSGATGVFQITKICLDDFNRFARSNQYELFEMYDRNKNREVALWYMNKRIPQLLNHFGYKDNVNNRLVAYNCGVGCLGKDLPTETKNYILSYHRRVAR